MLNKSLGSKEAEYRRLAMQHQEFGDQYAERSHEFDGELSNHYSNLAEAHHVISAAFSKRAGNKSVDEHESLDLVG